MEPEKSAREGEMVEKRIGGWWLDVKVSGEKDEARDGKRRHLPR